RFDVDAVEQGLPSVLEDFPAQARIAFGADAVTDPWEQQAWVCWLDQPKRHVIRRVTRGVSDITERTLGIGSVEAAFFICGEFTGSWSHQNGPYCDGWVLDDVTHQLKDSRLLVDLAHSRVRGSVYGPPWPRLVHQRQMERFASHGAAVLAHHHGGALVYGRPRT